MSFVRRPGMEAGLPVWQAILATLVDNADLICLPAGAGLSS